MKHENVKRLMTECGYSYRKLAPLLGITQKGLYLKLNGHTEFKYSEVIKICQILSIDNPRDWFSE